MLEPCQYNPHKSRQLNWELKGCILHSQVVSKKTAKFQNLPYLNIAQKHLNSNYWGCCLGRLAWDDPIYIGMARKWSNSNSYRPQSRTGIVKFPAIPKQHQNNGQRVDLEKFCDWEKGMYPQKLMTTDCSASDNLANACKDSW